VAGTTPVHIGAREVAMLAVEAIAAMIGRHWIRGRLASDQSSDARIALQSGNRWLVAGVDVAPRARFTGVADGATA
jgi:hypothetical protein